MGRDGEGWGGGPQQQGIRRGPWSWGPHMLPVLCARSRDAARRRSATPAEQQGRSSGGGGCTGMKASIPPTSVSVLRIRQVALQVPPVQVPQSSPQVTSTPEMCTGPGCPACSQLLPPEDTFKRLPVTGDLSHSPESS